ncbi:11077_t:CDS:2 [Funneliformis geosporum]|uniref:11077_t:CDS:1 n=1 Tax=Funneliformis geosporum TaxID=1117311 RepID=A0A9W4SEW9_9GLOM|nr:11077_t:CDS:2 [Funneliformis geosporum]
MYFFGGIKVDRTCSNEVFYLDITPQFDLEVLLWTDVTKKSGIGFKSCRASIVSDINNTIYLIGGVMENQYNEDAFTSLVHTFDLKSGKWNVPKIIGKEANKRGYLQAVVNNDGIIYAFGGREGLMYFNDMVLLNTSEFKWSYGPIINAPSIKHSYTATILPNGVIVFIGGREPFKQRQSSKF